MSVRKVMPVFVMFVLIGIIQTANGSDHFISRDIEFETDDGWTIGATLRLPPGAGRNNEFPAMVMLHEEGHDRLDTGDNDMEIAHRLPFQSGIATLAIDWRGRESSMGDQQPVADELHDFSTKTQEMRYLDVKGALEFLADYPGVDRLRLGIFASQFSAEPAVRAMREIESLPVRALVLLGGSNLSAESKDYLASVDTPIFTGASLLDKGIFLEMAEVYAKSKNPHSQMIAPVSAGRGMNLLHHSNLNRAKQSDVTVIDVMKWLETNVRNLGRIRAVSFKTRDGWEINGNLRYPDNLGKDGRLIPGIVQISGARSNRYSMVTYEKEFASRGYAVLSIELRGRGSSMQGLSYDSPEVFDVRENLLDSPYELDTLGAIDFLASVDGIDPNKIILVGEARGSRSALLAAAVDDRVKTMVLISVYDPDEPMEQAARQLNIPVMFVDTETNWAAPGTIHVHSLTRRGQLMIYPGLGHSHHIPYFHPEVSGFMADYLEKTLPPPLPAFEHKEQPLL
jgi:cephalosporin-C deacetylase-like acetyl esterase